MPSVPRLSGKEAIRAFEKAGFVVVRIKSSHHVMKKEGIRENIVIPVHGKQALGRGLLSACIKVAGMTIEEFCELL
jgi:predicted RNA binding protein YcfA (HicA-like mRNA interferase family)